MHIAPVDKWSSLIRQYESMAQIYQDKRGSINTRDSVPLCRSAKPTSSDQPKQGWRPWSDSSTHILRIYQKSSLRTSLQFSRQPWLVGLECNGSVNTIKVMSSRSVYQTILFSWAGLVFKAIIQYLCTFFRQKITLGEGRIGDQRMFLHSSGKLDIKCH